MADSLQAGPHQDSLPCRGAARLPAFYAPAKLTKPCLKPFTANGDPPVLTTS